MLTIKQNGSYNLQLSFQELLKLVRAGPLEELSGLEISPHASNMISKVPVNMQLPRLLHIEKSTDTDKVIIVECVAPDAWGNNGFPGIEYQVRQGLIIKGRRTIYRVEQGEGLTVKGLSFEQKEELCLLLQKN